MSDMGQNPACVDLFETADGQLYIYDPTAELYGRIREGWTGSTFAEDAGALQEHRPLQSVAEWVPYDDKTFGFYGSDIIGLYALGGVTVTNPPTSETAQRYLAMVLLPPLENDPSDPYTPEEHLAEYEARKP